MLVLGDKKSIINNFYSNFFILIYISKTFFHCAVYTFHWFIINVTWILNTSKQNILIVLGQCWVCFSKCWQKSYILANMDKLISFKELDWQALALMMGIMPGKLSHVEKNQTWREITEKWYTVMLTWIMHADLPSTLIRNDFLAKETISCQRKSLPVKGN